MAQWRIAEIYRTLNKEDEAVDAFRQVIKRFGNVVMKDQYYGYDHYDRWKAQDREYGPEAQLAIGDVLMNAKRFDDAIMEFRILMSKYGKTIPASVGANHTALCYEGKEDGETAVNVLKSVLRRYGKTAAASEAHTRLESKYKIADTEVSDSTDFFGDIDVEGPDGKNFIEDPTKMKDKDKKK